MAEKFWGNALAVATVGVLGVPTVAMAVGNGLRKVVAGDGTFGDGFDAVTDKLGSTIEKVEEFGDQHSEVITKAAVGAVTSVVFQDVARGAKDVIMPPKNTSY